MKIINLGFNLNDWKFKVFYNFNNSQSKSISKKKMKIVFDEF